MLKPYLAGVLTGAILLTCYLLWKNHGYVEPEIGNPIRFATEENERVLR